MAKIPTLKRLLKEDFKDQAWISKLLAPLNQFFESVVAALNKGLTFTDNFDAEIKSVTLDGTFPIQITLKSRPTGVIKINLQRADGALIILSQAVDFSWSLTNSGIQINSVAGISPSQTDKYLFTLLFINS